MTLTGIILALLTLAKAALDYATSRQQISAESSTLLATRLQGMLDALKDAEKVRVAVDAIPAGELRGDSAGFFRDR